MTSSSNPWLSLPETSAETEVEELPCHQESAQPDAAASGPTLPQQGVRAPSGLLRARVDSPARMWWVCLHGGAGGRTLSALVEDSAVVRQAWPDPATSEAPKAMLVARTHARGLLAARAAATDWAAGTAGVELLGLVLMADAPGRSPRPLKDLAKLVSGGVPRVWHLPWHEPWRLGEAPDLQDSPRPVRALVEDIALLAPKHQK